MAEASCGSRCFGEVKSLSVADFGVEMGLNGCFFLVRGARTGAFEMGEEGRFTGDGGIVRLLLQRNVC